MVPRCVWPDYKGIQMKVTLRGAAKEVTGSCYLVETETAKLLVDCGMFQGSRRLEKLNYIPQSIPVHSLDAVILTHGHLDHCGRLPDLIKAGYRGPIFLTDGTAAITSLILHDAAQIQENDLRRENRMRQRSGLKAIAPRFNLIDVERVCKQFRIVPYNEVISLAGGVRARLVDAGHILGSASVELFAEEIHEGSLVETKAVFSGDIGQYDVPIMHDPAVIAGCDAVFLESTYGDRDHRSLEESIKEFTDIINQTSLAGGKILIPTFAVGRAQQILYYLANLTKEGSIPRIPIFLDSPMAIAATEIYAKHDELLDEQSRMLISNGVLRTDLLKLRTCLTVEESQMLNSISGPCIIMAGAGMCNAGRILQHFKHNLWSKETTVVVVGYQAKGSLGRFLIDGAQQVKIARETIAVKAKIKSIGGFSAHAGQSDLLRWLDPMAKGKARVILTHGEPFQIQQLGYKIAEKYGIECDAPKLGDTITVCGAKMPVRP